MEESASASKGGLSRRNSSSMLDCTADSGPKEEAIRVCTRMRPLFEKEVNSGHLKAWKVNEQSLQLIIDPPTQSEMAEAQNAAKASKDAKPKKAQDKTEGQKSVVQRFYAMDKCFDDYSTNEEVYNYLAKDIVLDTFKGINGCCLAYGQTGSGKTHSIMGMATDPGLLPRSLAEFFDVISDPMSLESEKFETKSENSEDSETVESNSTEFLMRVSYVEIYMEKVNDLLQDGPKGPSSPLENLDVKEDPKKGFIVVGMNEQVVSSMDEVMGIIAKAEQKRHFAKTNFNEASSRSHTAFTVNLESNKTLPDGTSINKKGELKLIDLAGNERVGKATEGIADAKTVLEEGKAINKSLFLLSEVISKLSKKAQALADPAKQKNAPEEQIFIPWRESKLTRILSKSLGGNSRASVLVAVHPSHLYLDTSFSTLRFALKCKTIKKTIHVNYLSPEQSVIMQQKELISKLQNELKMISDNKAASPAALSPVDISQAAYRDEAVQELKKSLEEKVQKFQKIILKASLPSQITVSAEKDGGAGDFSRSKTLKFGASSLAPKIEEPIFEMQPSMEISPFGKAIDTTEYVRRFSLSTAMKYLKSMSQENLTDFTSKGALATRGGTNEIEFEVDSDIEHLLEAIDENVSPAPLNEGASFTRMYSVVSKLLGNDKASGEEGGEIEGTKGDKTAEKVEEEQAGEEGVKESSKSILNDVRSQGIALAKLKRKILRDKDEKEQFVEKTTKLSSEVKFLRAMMKKLGVSLVATVTKPSQESPASLKLDENEFPLDKTYNFNTFSDPEELLPLTSAIINKILTHSLLHSINYVDGKSALDFQYISDLPSGEKGSSSYYQDLPQTFDELVGISPVKEVEQPKVDAAVEKFTQDNQGKKEGVMKYLVENLQPWEQHILAVFYEQHEIKQIIRQLQDHFMKHLRQLQASLNFMLVEKEELMEHCERLHAAIWTYTAEFQQLSDDTEYKKFEVTMTKLEELSMAYASLCAKYKMVTEELKKEQKLNKEYSEKIKLLRRNNNVLFAAPHTFPNLEHMLSSSKTEREESLMKDVFLYQAKFSELKMKLEEARSFEASVRKLNASLYTLLIKSQNETKNVKRSLKLEEFTAQRQRKTLERNMSEIEKREASYVKQIGDLKLELEATKNKYEVALKREEEANEKLQDLDRLRALSSMDKENFFQKGRRSKYWGSHTSSFSLSTDKMNQNILREDIDDTREFQKQPSAMQERLRNMRKASSNLVSASQLAPPHGSDQASSAESSDVSASNAIKKNSGRVAAPAFQGDPRDKGFAGMMAALQKTPKK